ncbi:ferredoxin [Streptomyces sp. V3I7]|uniref:ferredoxin n=1 Tax=Streptomyces sp. V3I7 TaxID=3042278 RepID=UPI00278564F7|nr:ferredoxin [Streptomyces sp. V3I7]MDQ0988949.1 ferredoxin [Streptomyces sp. V3I7]
MRVVVDLNRCQGYAQCAFLAPDVFTMHGDEALVYNPRAADEHREAVARAVAACPVQAITVEGLDGPGGSPPESSARAREGLRRAQESFHGH